MIVEFLLFLILSFHNFHGKETTIYFFNHGAYIDLIITSSRVWGHDIFVYNLDKNKKDVCIESPGGLHTIYYLENGVTMEGNDCLKCHKESCLSQNPHTGKSFWRKVDESIFIVEPELLKTGGKKATVDELVHWCKDTTREFNHYTGTRYPTECKGEVYSFGYYAQYEERKGFPSILPCVPNFNCTKDLNGCFWIDSPVLMKDGSIKILRNVKVGDILEGRNGTESIVLEPIGVEGGMNDSVEVLECENGNELKVTDDHMVVKAITINGEKKIKHILAGDVKEGDIMVNASGEECEVTLKSRIKSVQVANLITDTDYYFVSNILVTRYTEKTWKEKEKKL